MYRITIITTAALALAAAACSKNDGGDEEKKEKDEGAAKSVADDEGARADDDEAKPSAGSAAVASDGPFGDYDLASRADALQGFWVVGGSSLGRKEAWHVDGNEVTIFDGDEEKTGELTVQSPCSVAVRTSDGVTTYTTYTIDGDTLYKGLGDAGAKLGDDIVACVFDKTYVYSGETCTAWKDFFGKWESEEAECSVEERDGKNVFVVGDDELEIVGDALVNHQMKGNVAEKHDDFGAAKSALASAQ